MINFVAVTDAATHITSSRTCIFIGATSCIIWAFLEWDIRDESLLTQRHFENARIWIKPAYTHCIIAIDGFIHSGVAQHKFPSKVPYDTYIFRSRSPLLCCFLFHITNNKSSFGIRRGLRYLVGHWAQARIRIFPTRPPLTHIHSTSTLIGFCVKSTILPPLLFGYSICIFPWRDNCCTSSEEYKANDPSIFLINCLSETANTSG